MPSDKPRPVLPAGWKYTYPQSEHAPDNNDDIENTDPDAHIQGMTADTDSGEVEFEFEAHYSGRFYPCAKVEELAWALQRLGWTVVPPEVKL